jgi:predicted nucleic acid-binding protein
VTLVVDASFIVAALTDAGPDGRWAEELVAAEQLAAPHLVMVEATNILRRTVLAGELSVTDAGMAHLDLVRLRVELFTYAPFAARVWELRENVIAYDAWYVAVAEWLGAPLATLDRRLTAAPGPMCTWLYPPEDPYVR